MALYRTGGGGGALSETVLWTNPSPTTNFPASTVTLSANFRNYKYLKIYFKHSKSASDPERITIFRASDIHDTNTNVMMIGTRQATGNARVRGVTSTSDTNIIFSLSYQTQSSSQSPTGDYCIPLKISGLK